MARPDLAARFPLVLTCAKPTLEERARYRRNQAYLAKLCLQAVNRLFEASGNIAFTSRVHYSASTGISTPPPIIIRSRGTRSPSNTARSGWGLRSQPLTCELYTATSLAHLWQRQGKHADACDLLAPAYGYVSRSPRSARSANSALSPCCLPLALPPLRAKA